jgi:hypothetical protein
MPPICVTLPSCHNTREEKRGELTAKEGQAKQKQMYGGLFGDLPAAKNDDKNGKEEQEDLSLSPRARVSSNGGSTTIDAGVNSNNTKNDTGEPAYQPKKRSGVVVEASSSSSLVQKLGVAGTAVAFVPTHIGRKRNSNNAVTKTKKPAAPVSLKPPVVSSIPGPKIQATHLELPKDTVATKISQETTTTPSWSSVVPAAKQVTATTIPTPVEAQVTAEESDEIRRLHEDVTDPYDPFVPNDLLQYWDRKAAERDRMELEREAQETLERQRAMQQQMELERTQMILAGNALGAADSILQGSRGRGRGVSNLPAWLVKQQQQQQQQEDLAKLNNDSGQ